MLTNHPKAVQHACMIEAISSEANRLLAPVDEQQNCRFGWDPEGSGPQGLFSVQSLAFS